jgi:HEAT repeat protein
MRHPLLLAVLLLLPSAPSGQDEMRRRVDQTIAEWRAHPKLSEVRLVQSLLELGPGAVPVLCGLVQAPEAELPLGAIARTLARDGGEQALEALGRVLTTEEIERRETVATALGESRGPAALEPLLVALGDEHPRVALAAARSVAELVSGDVIEAPVAALEHRLRAGDSREGYAFALARLEGEEAREALYRLAEDAFDPRIALAALMGLWESPRPEDAVAVAPLVSEAGNLAVRKQACLLMGRLQHQAAVRDLIDALHEEDVGLVKNAHWALRQITGQRLGRDAELWETWWKGSGRSTEG